VPIVGVSLPVTAKRASRLDIDLGSKASGNECKTEYIWLCARCAQEMHPKVEVTENAVTVRLLKNDPMLGDDAASTGRVN
jgi:hypothetical protein